MALPGLRDYGILVSPDTADLGIDENGRQNLKWPQTETALEWLKMEQLAADTASNRNIHSPK